MKKERCMLSGARLGKELWVEAVGTACYLVNRSPSSVLDDKTPQRHGLVRNLLSHISKYLVVIHMFMFQRKTKVS
jgi:hypothetical protein